MAVGEKKDPPFLLCLRQHHKYFKGLEDDEIPEEQEIGGYDMYFICSDGIVSAHRLVIANVSKYIMFMLDDQPPWYPIHIHIPDLPKSIVQTLVDLAYTGEMRFPGDLQSEVIDAMQTLGWVHSDCLSADFCDSEQGNLTNKDSGENENNVVDSDEEEKNTLNVQSTSKQEDLFAVLKMNFPVSSTAQQVTPKKTLKSPGSIIRANSFIEDDDESMEISGIPDFEVSDSEDASVFGTNKHKISPKKDLNKPTDDQSSETENSPSIGSIKNHHHNKDKKKYKNTQPSMSIGASEKRNSRRSSRRMSESNADVDSAETKDEQTKKPTGINKTPIKRGRKSAQSTPVKPETSKSSVTADAEPDTELVSIIEECSQMSNASENSNMMDSPGKRQRRKPKRFEEFEELPTRSKPSPVKAEELKFSKRGKKNVDRNQSFTATDTTMESLGSTSKSNTIDTNVSIEQINNNGTPKKNMAVKKCLKTPKNTLVEENEESKKQDIKVDSSISNLENGEAVGVNKSLSKTPAKRGTKKKLSSEGTKGSLITSYFTKKDSKQSEKSTEVATNSTDLDKTGPVQNSADDDQSTKEVAHKKSLKPKTKKVVHKKNDVDGSEKKKILLARRESTASSSSTSKMSKQIDDSSAKVGSKESNLIVTNSSTEKNQKGRKRNLEGEQAATVDPSESLSVDQTFTETLAETPTVEKQSIKPVKVLKTGDQGKKIETEVVDVPKRKRLRKETTDVEFSDANTPQTSGGLDSGAIVGTVRRSSKNI